MSFLKAAGFTTGLIIILNPFIADTPEANRAAGRFIFNFIMGGIALGIWGRSAKHKWSWFGYTWRFLICVVAAVIIGTLFQTMGAAYSN
jgi:hypothetical protein